MKSLFYFSLIFLLFSCSNAENEKKPEEKIQKEQVSTNKKIELKDLYFMEGNWKDISNTFEGFNEKWINMGDSLLQVVGYSINGSDTLISEVIKVKFRKGILNYIPRVVDQNEGKEILFGLSSGSTVDSFAFVNYEHDFPREIIYVKNTNTTVSVYLNGINENNEDINLLLVLAKTN